MKKWLVILSFVGTVYSAHAQYIPALLPGEKQQPAMPYDYWHPGNTFQHLDISVTAGTTGIGIDLATPLCQFLQLRAGYDFMPHFRKHFNTDIVVGGQVAPQYGPDGNRIQTPFDRMAKLLWEKYGYDMNEQVTLDSRLTMQNLKIMLDFFPFHHKNWHFTMGLYWGPTRIIDMTNSKASSMTLMCVGLYNQMYEKADASDEIKGYGKMAFHVGEYAHDISENGTVSHQRGSAYMMLPDNNSEINIEGTVNRFKPYIGFGYGGRLLKHRNDWKISFDCGALFWGGCPDMTVHDGTNLTKDIENISGKLGTFMDTVEILKLYPQLSVRLTKTIF